MSQLLPIMKQFLKKFTSVNNFDRLAAPVELIAVNLDGKLKFQWTVDETQVNSYGTLHGGYTSFLADYTTSIALAAINNKNAGVSVDLSVTYLNPAKVGEIVFIETECKKLGKRLAFLEFQLKNSDGKLLATAKHTKFIGNETNLKD
ncbi:acyl-coenzyme A thioesterase 13 [Hydra vulgaris]|uniref:Acyl-coenzyme A thioesterase 13 n=2 Tax=Hydra vulgaris TaxID=6087 RepID=A0ABM4DI95_HYDVU|nr:acyl-coenzyme A thioesterase 13 [Hydra vulgaris]